MKRRITTVALVFAAVASGKNGNVTASLTLSPPPSDIPCPKGQSLQLAQVTYGNVTLTDRTNNIKRLAGHLHLRVPPA